jgi:hypothetical protein
MRNLCGARARTIEPVNVQRGGCSESVSLATPRDQMVVKAGKSMMDVVLIFTVRCVLVSCFDPCMQCGACLNEPAVLKIFCMLPGH